VMCIFIRASAHMTIYVYTVFLKKVISLQEIRARIWGLVGWVRIKPGSVAD
jgi:hypothetical protein